jgi:XTP/dITP diphosphohydrolase
MKIIVATGNENKFREIARLLDEYGIDSERRAYSRDESGNTLEDIVRKKAEQAFRRIKDNLIVDDTGVYFDALDNFPGPYPRRVFEQLGFEGLLQKLKGRERSAHFKTLICYTDGRESMIFEGIMAGTITERVYKASRKNLPYEQVFVPEGFSIPVCMMSIGEKSKISHRAEAVRKFAEFFIAKEKKKSS